MISSSFPLILLAISATLANPIVQQDANENLEPRAGHKARKQTKTVYTTITAFIGDPKACTKLNPTKLTGLTSLLPSDPLTTLLPSQPSLTLPTLPTGQPPITVPTLPSNSLSITIPSLPTTLPSIPISILPRHETEDEDEAMLEPRDKKHHGHKSGKNHKNKDKKSDEGKGKGKGNGKGKGKGKGKGGKSGKKVVKTITQAKTITRTTCDLTALPSSMTSVI